MRSSYNCQDVGDVALYFDLEEFCIMKRSGNIVMYDANTKTETLKVVNENPHPPVLEAEEALDRNPLQGPPNPLAIGPGLGDGNAHANRQQQQPQQQQQQYKYQLFVNNRTVKFSYILTLFILILQFKVSSFLRTHERFLTGMYAYMRPCRQRTSRLSRMTMRCITLTLAISYVR